MANKLLVNELNRRITIQHFTTVDIDPEGIVTKEWAPLVTVWAKRTPVNGRDYFQAAADNAEKTVKYVIRYRKDIKANMRIQDHSDGLIYDIKTPLDDYYGDRTQTHLMVELIEDG